MRVRTVPSAIEAELGADRVAEAVALAGTGRIAEALDLVGDVDAGPWLDQLAAGGLWALSDGTVVGRHHEGA